MSAADEALFDPELDHDPDDLVAWALSVSSEVRHLNMMVGLLALAAPDAESGQPFCYACIWEQVLKPMAYPQIGWGRGYPVDQAIDPENWWKPVDLSRVALDDPEPARGRVEKWLRTDDAWNVLTDWWMKRLHDVDPGNGHGFVLPPEFDAIRARADAFTDDALRRGR